MSDRDIAIDFARGVMDRLRERWKELDPKGFAQFEAAPLIDDKMTIDDLKRMDKGARKQIEAFENAWKHPSSRDQLEFPA